MASYELLRHLTKSVQKIMIPNAIATIVPHRDFVLVGGCRSVVHLGGVSSSLLVHSAVESGLSQARASKHFPTPSSLFTKNEVLEVSNQLQRSASSKLYFSGSVQSH